MNAVLLPGAQLVLSSNLSQPVRDLDLGPLLTRSSTHLAYTEVVRHPPMTVVETVRFLKDADGLIPEPERARLVEFIGSNPESGDLIPETGGVRKLRWALPGGGKRGGARVIYLFYNEALPVFLLAMYSKNEKANLSKAERNAIAKLVPVLVQGYSKGRGAK
jgi:hypothetical protein